MYAGVMLPSLDKDTHAFTSDATSALVVLTLTGSPPRCGASSFPHKVLRPCGDPMCKTALTVSSSLAYASMPASSSLPSSDFPSPKSPVEFLRGRNAVGGSAAKMAGWRLPMNRAMPYGIYARKNRMCSCQAKVPFGNKIGHWYQLQRRGSWKPFNKVLDGFSFFFCIKSSPLTALSLSRKRGSHDVELSRFSCSHKLQRKTIKSAVSQPETAPEFYCCTQPSFSSEARIRRSVSSRPSTTASSMPPPGVNCLPETATRSGYKSQPFFTPSFSISAKRAA